MASIPSGQRRLENSLRPKARAARVKGPADPSEAVQVIFVVRRRSDAPALRSQSYWMSTPPGRRSFLSRPDFARQYGAAPEELDKVAKFAQDQGLTVTKCSVARRCVIASGPLDIMARVFSVEFNTYESTTEIYRGFNGYAHLPADIADIVEGVLGLDNRRLGRHAMGGGPIGAQPVTPIEVAKFYDFPLPTGSSNSWRDATGQTIGILEFNGGYDVNDMKAYWSSLSISPQANIISVPPNVPLLGTSQLPFEGDQEVALDVEIAGAIAAGAKIVIYFGQGFLMPGSSAANEAGWYTLLSTAIHDSVNNPTVLSISYGAAESAWGPNTITMMTPLFSDAAQLGMTVFACSGDAGASGFQDGDSAFMTGQHVLYPASDPWVTGCGGTVLVGPPLSQQTWNDESGATGGGVSVIFTNSADYPWQSNVNINGQPLAGRGVPDVAGNASNFSGYDIIIYGMRSSALNSSHPHFIATPSGTSAVAPLYAGLIALINANLLPNSITTATSVGYLNPLLYTMGGNEQSLAESNAPFQDIADGGDNGYNGAPGYQSVAGWDACTGWGSIDGTALLLLILANYVGENPGCLAALRAWARAVVGK